MSRLLEMIKPLTRARRLSTMRLNTSYAFRRSNCIVSALTESVNRYLKELILFAKEMFNRAAAVTHYEP